MTPCFLLELSSKKIVFLGLCREIDLTNMDRRIIHISQQDMSRFFMEVIENPELRRSLQTEFGRTMRASVKGCIEMLQMKFLDLMDKFLTSTT